MKIHSLHVYPLKSARGIDLPEAQVDAFGLALDRRMMLVDPDGKFVSQRELPALATMTAIPGAAFLTLRMGEQEMMVAPPNEDLVPVILWNKAARARVAAASVNERLSAWLGRPLRLVFLDRDTGLYASQDWAGEGVSTAFSDGYPVLITTTGSLADLNRISLERGEKPVGMERFRPNIVIDCDKPWAEDFWASLAIGGITFDLVKPCSRCVITTQDQETGSRDGANPMPTMQYARLSADRRVIGPLFGWNAVARQTGKLTIGDAVSVTRERPEGWAFKQR
jgi:uncharacterized protein